MKKDKHDRTIGKAQDVQGLNSLGRTTRYVYDHPDAKNLEVFENLHPENDYVINLFCHEFTSLCPVTGQPDWGKFIIRYIPNKLCVESKSLKLYLLSFRNHGEFHEDVTNRIAKDLFTLMKPKYLQIYGNFNSRGGIAIHPFVELYAKTSSKNLEQFSQMLKNMPVEE